METFLPDLVSSVGSWLSGEGPASDVVVSTRVRLARNVLGFPFAAKMTEERGGELVDVLRSKLEATTPTSGMRFIPLRKSTEVCRDALLERFLISRELAASRGDRGVAFGDGESVSVMINEEDHLRLQSLRAGFDLEQAFERMLLVDRALETVLEYAFSARWGYLTSCPTNLGTGLRVSVMLHLPGLAMVSRELKKVFNAASRLNLAIRGLHGEGSQATGAFFQISNQVTLGRTERELVDDLRGAVPNIVEFERRVRRTLFEAKGKELRERVEEAATQLQSGRAIALDVAVSGLSTLLLAASLNGSAVVLPERLPSRAELLRTLVLVHPGHLQARAKRRLPSAEVDKERGSYLKSVLGEDSR